VVVLQTHNFALCERGTECHYLAVRVGIGSECYLFAFIHPLCLVKAHFAILTVIRLKCNRAHPCDNCVRRGDASSCSYAAPGSRKKNQSQEASTPDDMQNRIDRLEGLVLSLMTNGAQSAGPAAATAAISRSQSDSAGSFASPLELDNEENNMIKEEDEEGDNSEVEGVTNSLGHLKVDADKGKSLYMGDSHWNMVLADVSFDSQNFLLRFRLYILSRQVTGAVSPLFLQYLPLRIMRPKRLLLV
jgi:hypothetical protein